MIKRYSLSMCILAVFISVTGGGSLAATVLWNQPLSTTSSTAYMDQEFPDQTAKSSYIADDFTNTSIWRIDSIFIPGDMWNPGTTLLNATSLEWRIYADAAGVPAGDPSGGGSSAQWSLSLPPNDPQVSLAAGTSGYASNTTLTLSTPLNLPAGTWWLVFYPIMTIAAGGQYGPQQADTTSGSVAQFINPGGGWGVGTGWQDWSVLGASQADMAFRIEGAGGSPLDDAVDQTSLTWNTLGNGSWYGQSTVTHDGEDAAQSGAIANNESTTIQTTTGSLAKTTFLSFWWKVSSDSDDFLRFFVDGVQRAAISGEVDWTQVQHVVLGPGNHTLTWTYAKVGSASAGSDAGWLDQVAFTPSLDLDDALEQPSLTWNISGSGAWYGQAAVTHDGVDAAQSGAIGNGHSSIIGTTTASFTQTTFLNFWWKVSSESGLDILRLTVDGLEQAAISGEVDWTQVQVALAPGSHTLAWTYVKSSSGSAGSDAGWLDQVEFTPSLDLGESVDQSLLTWNISGSGSWYGEGTVTHDGADAAHSGAVGDGQSATLETHTGTLAQPSFLNFWWKVSSQSGSDFLRLFVDGVEETAISGEVDWTWVQVALAPGDHTLTWTYAKDGTGSVGSDAGWLDEVGFTESFDLGESVNQSSLTWNISGDGFWYGQGTVTHDGSTAAQSGRLGHSQSATLGTTTGSLAASTLLSFWWKVSSETGDDALRFYIDGTERAAISGEEDWARVEAVLAPGIHTLAWTYAKGASGSAGSDAAWLDQVAFDEPLFFDNFSDGKLVGDAHWTKMQGFWNVKSPTWNHNKLYQSSSASPALSKVKSFTTTAAQLRARFKIGAALNRSSVSFAFDIKSLTKYRYVEIKQLSTGKWQALLKQKGAFDKDVQRTRATVALPGFSRTAIHALRLDIYADGGVVAWLDGKMLFDTSFGGGGAGGVGLKSDFTTLYADDFTVYDANVLQ